MHVLTHTAFDFDTHAHADTLVSPRFPRFFFFGEVGWGDVLLKYFFSFRTKCYYLPGGAAAQVMMKCRKMKNKPATKTIGHFMICIRRAFDAGGVRLLPKRGSNESMRLTESNFELLHFFFKF